MSARRILRISPVLSAATALGVMLLALLCAAALRMPLSFDGAYNLEIVHHLLRGDGYATDGYGHAGKVTVFNPVISTGPTVMLPIAATAFLFGEHVWVYRLVPLCAFVGLVVLWAVVGNRTAGRWGAVAAVTGVLMVDTLSATWSTSVLYGPGDALGEVTAVVLLLAGALLLERPWLAGLAVGLAVMAKTLSLLFVPALVVAYLVRRCRDDLVRLTLGLLVPILGWQLVRVVAVGPAAAMEANRQFLSFFFIGGSGLLADERTGAGGRILEESKFLFWPGLIVLVVACALAVSTVWHKGRLVLRPQQSAVHVAIVGALTIELWWLLVADRDWVRHAVPAAYLLVPAVLAMSVDALRAAWWFPARITLTVLLVSGSFAAVASNLVHAWNPPGPTLAEQEELARFVARHGNEYGYLDEWRIAPELSVLGGARAEPLRESPALVLIRLRTGGTPNPQVEEDLALCHRRILTLADFVVCEGASVPPR